MIHRSRHAEDAGDFTQINNSVLRDAGITSNARLALCVMLSHSDDWKFTRKGLCRECGWSAPTLNKALCELEEHGYFFEKRKPGKDPATGKFISGEWEIYEEPRFGEGEPIYGAQL